MADAGVFALIYFWINPAECTKRTEVERLRRFLIHILCCDYNIYWDYPDAHQYRATQEDHKHYVRLASELRALEKHISYESQVLRVEPAYQSVRDTVVRKFGHPANQLGLPWHIAADLLWRYADSLDEGGRCTSSFEALLYRDRRSLSRKVRCDRTQTIPIIISTKEARLRQRLVRSCHLWA